MGLVTRLVLVSPALCGVVSGGPATASKAAEGSQVAGVSKASRAQSAARFATAVG